MITGVFAVVLNTPLAVVYTSRVDDSRRLGEVLQTVRSGVLVERRHRRSVLAIVLRHAAGREVDTQPAIRVDAVVADLVAGSSRVD